MKKFLLTIFVLCSLTAVTFPQQANNRTANDDVLISKGHPTVYITFERYGKAIDISQSRLAEPGNTTLSRQQGRDVWLRLHNNTRWTIEINSWSFYLIRQPNGSFGLNDGMEANIIYGVLEGDGRLVPYGGDSFSNSWLPPGHSVLFSVRRDHLSNNRSIFVAFRYEWESEHGFADGVEPTHRAEFDSYHLPENEH